MKEDMLRRGESLYNENRLEEAESCFLGVLSEGGENDAALNNLGVIAFQRGATEKAIGHFKSSLQLNPGYRDALLNLVAANERANDPNSSVPFLLDYLKGRASDSELIDILNHIESLRQESTRKEGHQEKAEGRCLRSNPDSEKSSQWGSLWQNIRLEDILREPSHQEIADHVARSGLKGKTFLEVGSGTGGTGMSIARHGAGVTLFDLSSEALDLSQRLFQSQHLEGRFVRGDMLALPFANNSFDAVGSFGVLEHLTEKELVLALKEMARVSRGTVITTVPNRGCIFYRLGKWYAEKTGSWQYGFERPEYSMISYFRAAGLDVYMEYPVGFVDSLAFLNRVPETPKLQRIAFDFNRENPDLLTGSLIISFGAKSGAFSLDISPPLVSVLMCAWNAEPYIKASIESVLNQTYANLELIIVDDGSTDRTKEMIHQFRDPRLRYTFKNHTGLADSRNAAQSLAKGHYTVIVDADDIIDPHLIKREVLVLESQKGEPTVVYSDIELITDNAEKTGTIWRYRDYAAEEIIPLLFLAGKNIVPEASMMIPRTLLNRVGKYNPNVRDSDNEFIARLARHAKRFLTLRQSLYYYRRYEGTLSTGRTAERVQSSIAMLEKMLEVFGPEELFPSVEWDKLSDEMRDSLFHGKVAGAYWKQCKAYMPSGTHQPLFAKAAEHLEKAIKASPFNKGVRDIGEEVSSALIGGSGEVPLPPSEKPEGFGIPLSYGTGKAQSPLRILYFADTRSPHTKRYLSFFRDKGHEVHVFDTSGHRDGLEGVTLHTPAFRKEDHLRTDEASRLIHTVLASYDVVRKVRPHLVHGHYLTGWCWWACLPGFMPTVVTPWGSDIFLDTRNPVNRRLAQFCLGEASMVTADSRDLLESAVGLRGTRAGVHYIPFGIDTEHFAPGKDVSSLAERLRIRGSKVVLSPRQFKPEANIHVLIKAIPEVVRRIPETFFILKTYLTNSPYYHEYRGSLEKLVRELRVEGNVRFLDDLDFNEMPLLYNLADVMVTLRDTDGSSCSMLEAMACRVPVVASDIPSMREWISSGENGMLVNQRDPDAVARAIVKVLQQGEERIPFSERNWEMVKRKADYRENWAEVGRLYANLLDGRGEAMKATWTRYPGYVPVFEALAEAMGCTEDGRLDHGKALLAQVINANGLPAYFYIRGFLGLGKTSWLEGNVRQAEAFHRKALQLFSGFELQDPVGAGAGEGTHGLGK